MASYGLNRIRLASVEPRVQGFCLDAGVSIFEPAAKEVSFNAEALHSSFKPTGIWQAYEIQAIGPRVAVRVNGVLVSEAELGRLSGHIGLQGETPVVEYRNISVREIIAP